jgi:HAD superfamily hydrolase (TIGR01450 family)
MLNTAIQKKLQYKKYFILDLDGTLYKGNDIFPFTLPFLKKLRATGRTPIFLTNNSSKCTQEYFAKLKKLKFTKNINEIYTSGLATIEYLQHRGIKKIFLLATPAVEKEFLNAGFILEKKSLNKFANSEQQNGLNKAKNATKSLRAQTQNATVSSRVNSPEALPGQVLTKKSVHAHDLPQAVVLTFDKTFTYQKFTEAYEYIMAGVPFYASHPDTHLPLEGNNFHPDIGTLISAFQTATGKLPTVIGKPQKTIYRQLQAHLNCKKSEMIMIGDRLYTDIKGAKDYGITSVLVLSGETTPAMLKKSKTKPDLVLKDVSETVKSL